MSPGIRSTAAPAASGVLAAGVSACGLVTAFSEAGVIPKSDSFSSYQTTSFNASVH